MTSKEKINSLRVLAYMSEEILKKSGQRSDFILVVLDDVTALNWAVEELEKLHASETEDSI